MIREKSFLMIGGNMAERELRIRRRGDENEKKSYNSYALTIKKRYMFIFMDKVSG